MALKTTSWSVDQSAELYGIPNWGAGYFSASDRGNVEISVQTTSGEKSIDLFEVVTGIQERGFDMPVLLRLENVLDSQISRLNRSFAEAIKKQGYKGVYRGVFPIKVNQQQQVIEEVTRFGKQYHHGLEAGSKAELIAALSMMEDKEALIVCNGYKDAEFIDLGLQGIMLGFNIIFVVEMRSEVPLILERSKLMGVTPHMGIRMKLRTKASGLWSESGGSRSVFGLSTAECIDVIDTLKEENALQHLKLLHYHLGSQIPNIRDIRRGVAEASRLYGELTHEGAALEYLDLGGGLAVDYDGSKTNFHASRNYSLDEYSSDIVEIVMSTLDEKGVKHPTIVTESGRATVAYYSILLFNVLDVSCFDPPQLPEELPELSSEMTANLFDAYKTVSSKNLQEWFNDITYYNDEILAEFQQGKISLRERAYAESLYWKTLQKIALLTKGMKRVPVELQNIDDMLTDIYFCNFSLFQSLPDSWAIDQLFPVMPIHRLSEEPKNRGILSDITCDSDGKIAQFIDLHETQKSLPLHTLKDGEEYYLGVFMVGAYQETLGDLHNLMGDTNVVTVRINEDGSYDVTRELEGDTVADVLSYVEYDPKLLLQRYRNTAEEAVKEKRITLKQRREIVSAFESGLRGYTYYER